MERKVQYTKVNLVSVKSKLRIVISCFAVSILLACNDAPQANHQPGLSISNNRRHLVTSSGEPFFWLGGTVWGMSEWMTREDIDFYLDDRSRKGFSVVQVCLLWGKREENPISFTINAPNAYGHKALAMYQGMPDPTQPMVEDGGTTKAPNDYWDHVDYLVEATAERNMILALLPVWGRRYVNATHPKFSISIFSADKMNTYGAFLGRRYGKDPNIIWVLGGDVKADHGADHRPSYRAMAEGILTGITGALVAWNEPSPLWDQVLMTYHPDGSPMVNSSTWFHKDAWLDFHMIETFVHKDSVIAAVRYDYQLNNPIKPTVMGEPAYEGSGGRGGPRRGIHMRRQAYQSFFAGVAGFTYGVYFDDKGNGPLFSPFGEWKEMLDLEGAQSMKHLKAFCMTQDWPNWIPDENLIQADTGSGQYEQLAVVHAQGKRAFIYLPDNRVCKVSLDLATFTEGSLSTRWFDPSTGTYGNQQPISVEKLNQGIRPPDDWQDALLILSW